MNAEGLPVVDLLRPSRLLYVSKQLVVLCWNFILDFVAYARFSATVSPYSRKETLQAWITVHYHAIEKGLSLPTLRTGFSGASAIALMSELEIYVARYGWDQLSCISFDVLEMYRNVSHEQHSVAAGLDSRLDRLRHARSRCPESGKQGGVVELQRETILKDACIDFRRFANSRHSVRSFSGEPVGMRELREAIAVAQRTPSVCNRQPWRVHIFAEQGLLRAVLGLQKGNRGFGDSASVVLLVSCQLGAFIGPGERNEAYIDGGMFSMSLVYALHSLGLATCCLGLCQQNEEADRLRVKAHIPRNEVLVMLIAVGRMPASFQVPVSRRKPVSDLLVEHQVTEP